MTIKIHLLSQSNPIIYVNGVINAYTKDGLYCIYMDNNEVHKYPLVSIFRITENYK